MDIYNTIGYSGVFVASVSLWPQICQIIRTQQVRDLNRCYFFLCVLAEILYITYGIVKNDYVMIASTIPPTISQIIVIVLHFKYKKNEDSS